MARAALAYPGLAAAGGALACLLVLQLQQQRTKKVAEDGSASIDSLHDVGGGCHDLPPLSEEERDALASTAQALATRGRGILAADESTPTVRVGLGCDVQQRALLCALQRDHVVGIVFK